MGESKYIPEELYEAFFERYFEYGEDATKENAIKAVKLLKHAYKAAEQVSESAENGELFDEAEAVLAVGNPAVVGGDGRGIGFRYGDEVPERSLRILYIFILCESAMDANEAHCQHNQNLSHKLIVLVSPVKTC